MHPPPVTDPSAPPRAVLRPWRSAGCGWAVAVLALVAGVPLFLRMPPWPDITLYDMAARALLRGGVLYRDVFDTNLPGVVWVMAGVRSVLGWSYEALRAWDLFVVGAAVGLLVAWLRRAGPGPAAAAWFAAAAALFYPYISEFNHCQRDTWMLLPAAAAGLLRVRQVTRTAAGRVSVVAAAGEGIVWGLAVWIKPHAIFMAGGVWLVSAAVIARRAGRRAVALDLAGLVAGGLLVGGAGVGWMVRSGAWPHFWDIFTNWNPDYLASVWSEVGHRLSFTFWCFRPWSPFHLLAVPLAAWDAWKAVRRGAGNPAAARGLLGALYLSWLAQALLLQRGFHYVHVPITLLLMAVLSARGWSAGFLYLAWIVFTGAVVTAADAVPELKTGIRAVNRHGPYLGIDRHRLADWPVMALWPRCWAGGSMELRDRLGHDIGIHCDPTWQDLGAVAGYLRAVDPPVGDRQLTCWHDSTHPLYLMLDLEPSTRYMHYGTALAIDRGADQIRREVAASPQRYVVADLARMTWYPERAREPGAHGPHALPAWFPLSQRGRFPWDQPLVFRAGRYTVHRVGRRPEPGEIDIPAWGDLGDLGPGEGDE